MNDVVSGSIDLRTVQDSDVVVIGGGFGGLYAVHAMRSLGLSVQGFEAGSGLGGTWFWNRYPGARCDIESLEYSFSFDEDLQQDWTWSERYARQPEILAYADHFADRFDLKGSYQLETRVTAANFDATANEWLLDTEHGDRCRTRWLVLATGGIAVPHVPDFPGREQFGGASVHTAQWPAKGIDCAGKRVAIIGTGSSAIQAIPELASEAKELFVLQRSPNYVVPSQNSERDPIAEREIKTDYARFRSDNHRQSNGFGSRWDRTERSVLSFSEIERQERFDQAWKTGGFSFLFSFGDLTASAASAEPAAAFIRQKIDQIVERPEVAQLLTPNHVFGCRRLCVGTDYYETFNRKNVTLVDVSDNPIAGITTSGIDLGVSHLDVDVIVYATGFEDQAASLRQMSIVGDGSALNDSWRTQPVNYLGVSVCGFPNLFMVNMPGSPSIATNMITNTEFTVDWIVACIEHARRQGWDRIEVDEAAQDNWTSYVNSIAQGKVYELCHNLYTGLDPSGERFAYPHLGVPAYLERLDDAQQNEFAGMRFSRSSGEVVSANLRREFV